MDGIPITPNQQREKAKAIGKRIRLYSVLFVSVVLASSLVTGYFLYANYQYNYVKGDYYVLNGNEYRILPVEEEFPELEPIAPEIIKPSPKPVPGREPVSPEPILPPYVDLRPEFTYIKDQGQQASCIAFTLNAMMEFRIKRDKNRTVDLSEAFLYYEARREADATSLDEGCRWLDAVNVLLEEGVCTEGRMPYDDLDYRTPPSGEALAEALQYRADAAFSVEPDLDLFRVFLSEGYPIALGLVVFSSFAQGADGVIPMPTGKDLRNCIYGNRTHGLHAVLVVGYDDSRGCFIIRNSWGDDFGDNGYGYLPYDYVMDEFLCPFSCVVPFLNMLS